MKYDYGGGLSPSSIVKDSLSVYILMGKVLKGLILYNYNEELFHLGVVGVKYGPFHKLYLFGAKVVCYYDTL